MKKPVALPDTNYILRYLLRDDAKQFEETDVFFEQVRSGTQCAMILESVVTECFYVLTKHYKVPRNEAAKSMQGILAYKGTINTDRERLTAALTRFITTSLDPVDCLLAATAKDGHYTLRTFDKALLKHEKKEI
jgi:predicted nucleic-acid-binding protein